MAEITSILKLKGSIANLVIRNSNGKQIAYLKPHFSKEKWLKSPNYARSRENAQNFGGASKCAAAIYKAISWKHNKWFKEGARNELANQLRKHNTQANRAAATFSFINLATAFKNLDMSPKESLSSSIQIRNIGPQHNPDHCKIIGLRETADRIDPNGLLQLECRILRRSIHFPEIAYDAANRKWESLNPTQIEAHQQLDTGWFHVDHIPSEAMRFDLAAPQEFNDPQNHFTTEEMQTGKAAPHICFILIEWRSTAGPNPGAKYQHSLVRCVAIQMPQQLAAQIHAQKPKQTAAPRSLPQELKPTNKALTRQTFIKGIFGRIPPI